MIDKLKNFIKNLDLKRQLGVIVVFSLILSLISLILILPNLLTPFYEKNIYADGKRNEQRGQNI